MSVCLQGFKYHWYSSNRVLQIYDGSRPADPQALLKHVPQLPGLHLWLVKPPCSRCARLVLMCFVLGCVIGRPPGAAGVLGKVNNAVSPMVGLSN